MAGNMIVGYFMYMFRGRIKEGEWLPFSPINRAASLLM
jgi:hypothetical protein